MRYAVWNNKGGVGKTFLSFVLAVEYAVQNPDEQVIVVDMCPQANVSEIILGGNGTGSEQLERLLRQRATVGGYFDKRIESPHALLGTEADFLLQASNYNPNMPLNLWLIAGDPSLEIQAQVISQISGQTLPENSWKNVHAWLRDLVIACSKKLGMNKLTIFIDCNPSFSAYTELALLAAERIIVPCSSDGSSARAIDNIGALLYGVSTTQVHQSVGFYSKTQQFAMALPVIHSVILNRSTQYNKEASKAFNAMFEAIKRRVDTLRSKLPTAFVDSQVNFKEIPDSHSVAIVCSHSGLPLSSVKPGKYQVHDTNPQVNSDPLNRYKDAVAQLLETL